MVRNHHHQTPFVGQKGLHPFERLLLKGGISNAQNLVKQQNVCLQLGGYRETQPDFLTGGIVFQGQVQLTSHPGEVHYGVQLAPNFGPTKAQNLAVEVNVLPSRQFRMEPGADLQQTGQSALNVQAPGSWGGDTGEQTQQSRFPGSVGTHHANGLPGRPMPGNRIQRRVGTKFLGQLVEGNVRCHTQSAAFFPHARRINQPEKAKKAPTVAAVHQSIHVRPGRRSTCKYKWTADQPGIQRIYV